MAKSTPAPSLFAAVSPRQRRVLILSKYLYGPDPQNLAEAQYHHDAGPDFDSAHALIKKWADMERSGLLKKKETALDANYLSDVFGTALHYILNGLPDTHWGIVSNFSTIRLLQEWQNA
jgi:hypothetical protein